MAYGLLFITDGYRNQYLPVFCGDRELAYSVFVDAMKTCEKRGEKDRFGELKSFFPIVEKLGKERRGTGPNDCPIFLSPEAVSQQCFDGEESACKRADYIFAADFENEKIVTLK